jgi:NTP pyrophosphatase (non-canonical NTP hydrolase)
VTFEEYQERAKITAKYPAIGGSWVYPTLGLANEAGEVAGKVKKAFRDDGGKMTATRLADIQKELGDVLWYISALCTELGITLEETADINLTKLAGRAARGTINGDGDNR